MEYPTTPTTWLIEPGKEVGMTVMSWTIGGRGLRPQVGAALDCKSQTPLAEGQGGL